MRPSPPCSQANSCAKSPKRRLNEIYVKHCGRTYDEVETTLDRDHFMSASEAKDWGIVDHVYETRDGAEAEVNKD